MDEVEKIVKVDRTDTKGKIDKTDRKARNIDRYIDGDRQRWINRENPEKPTKPRNEAKKKHMDKWIDHYLQTKIAREEHR